MAEFGLAKKWLAHMEPMLRAQPLTGGDIDFGITTIRYWPIKRRLLWKWRRNYSCN